MSSAARQSIKAGTLIEFFVSHPQGRNELARVGRWTRVNGPVKNHVHGKSGWHVVRFDDGGGLIVHETGFRVVDNRIAA